MRSTKDIDKDSATVGEKVKKLEADKKHALEALDRSTHTRQEVAFAALSSGDEKAQSKLKKANEDQVSQQVQVENIDFALTEAHQKLHALQVEREQVFLAEKRAELAVVGKLAAEEAQKIDETLITLVSQLTEHVKTLKRLSPITAYLGHTKIFNLDRFRRCLHGRLHKSFMRDFDCYADYRNDFSYAERLSEYIQGLSTEVARPASLSENQHAKDLVAVED